ncbi:tyrosine-type recombinase/integrase [Mesorhizobium sp. M0106]|uniref:tyrosine-type recombinase/integrase n=1 Tax=Mesorhizobium sp. M0106 TaxID=2956880 RepID=UPI00333CA36B
MPLGKTEAEALARYKKVHGEAEQQLKNAALGLKAPQADSSGVADTALDLFQRADRKIRRWKLDPDWSGSGSDFNQEVVAREIIAESIAKKYPVGDDGYPIGVSPNDTASLRALMLGSREVQPHPTLEDARKLYLEERVGDDKTKQMELDRIFKLVREGLGRDRKLSSLKRQDAKEVRAHMIDGRKASSVDRYLNVVRAAINHAIREYDLKVTNPFMYLEAAPKDKAEPDKDKRRPFTLDEAAAIRARIMSTAKEDLQHIWRLLDGTGSRLAETSGLRVSDIHLDHASPHMTVEWHADRRIKNKVSRRNVPLIGDALEAARAAVKAAGNATMLFPAYGRPRGPASASAALGKHVRACVSDPKATTHSLRHLMKDRLRLAGVTKSDQDIVLGHSSGSVGEDYGGDEVRLEVARRALEKALTKAG